jgi:HK97 family phage major capsid protein
VVADLIAPGTTDSTSIVYMKESSFTNAAATVAEGATKPESTLVFDQATDPVRKIAHWLPVTEEMLEDVSQIRSYIDARLRLGVELEEEDQLLNGDGTAPNISGILDRSGLTAAQARGADTNADAIFKQITTIATTVFVQPTGIVMNPANWQTVQLTKNAAGNYLGNGPWAPAQPAQLWGLPVAVTPSIAANLGLVGDFRGSAQVFRKGGLRVEASNSHSDFFVKNLVAIRAEERLALAVYREAAFGTVTGLN